MSVFRAFNERPQFFDDNGDPLAGGKLFWYEAGSSTKCNTFTDSTGATPNADPMILDAAGRPQTEIWLTAGQAYKAVASPSTDTDPPTNSLWDEDDIRGIGDVTATSSEWLASGLTPTYISATSFSVPGDQTSTLKMGRALKIVDSGGTKYGWIKESVFTTLTTVTMDQNSDTLASPVSTVSYGILQGGVDSSVPISSDDIPIREDATDGSKQWRADLANVPTGTTMVSVAGAGTILPAGLMFPYAGSSIPTGWLDCDGSAISRTTYAALFAAISTAWGAGDGSLTFNLPDCRGRAPIGAGTGTVAESATASSGNGFTVVSNATKWLTGQPVILSSLTGFTTTATAGPTYYVVRISATNIRLATTLALAQAETPDITISGTGTVTVTGTLTARTLGQGGGSETKAMTASELLAHVHAQTNAGSSIQHTDAAGTASPRVTPVDNTASTGGNVAMNIMQPFIVTKYIISY